MKKNQRVFDHDEMIKNLTNACPNGICRDVELSKLSRWKVGGIAKLIVSPSSKKELMAVMDIFNRFQFPFIVIGMTTNLLFSDEGVDVGIVRIAENFSAIDFDGLQVVCAAGTWVPGFARKLCLQGLGGGEHIVGIPGTVGGLICMNGGSQRKGIGDNILTVTTVNKLSEIKVYEKNECRFSYRSSIFQHVDEIVIEAKFQFIKLDAPTIRKDMLQILRSRRRKFPQKLPNCGSVFVSDPSMYEKFGPPGEIIEKCGLKGHSRGNAQISKLHANFIINRGDASANDILYLIHLINKTVFQTTGHNMIAEAKYVSKTGEFKAAHLVANEIWGR